MKVYLNDDKIHVDPRPHNNILWGLKAHCDSRIASIEFDNIHQSLIIHWNNSMSQMGKFCLTEYVVTFWHLNLTVQLHNLEKFDLGWPSWCS